MSEASSQSKSALNSAAAVEALLAAFTRACLDVFAPDRVTGVVAHGSAIKGGLIPGFSDADFMVFLTPDCFEPGPETDPELQTLPDQSAFDLQERIGGLPWRESGFGYPQAYFYDPARMPDWWTGPAPGAYRVLHGRLPDGFEATDERLRRASERFLRQLRRTTAADIRNFADSIDDQVPRRLRLICTSVTPAIFSLATLDEDSPTKLWAGTKFEALERLRQLYPAASGPAMAVDLYARLRTLYSAAIFDLKAGRDAYRLAVAFLRWTEGIASARPEPNLNCRQTEVLG